MPLVFLPGEFAICRLDSLPQLDWEGPFISLTRTADEISLVCPVEVVPPGCRVNAPWRLFRIAGTLDFSLVGVLSRISAVLAQSGISIFTVSTYDTDYILVPAADCEKTVAALRDAGHEVACSL